MTPRKGQPFTVHTSMVLGVTRSGLARFPHVTFRTKQKAQFGGRFAELSPSKDLAKCSSHFFILGIYEAALLGFLNCHSSFVLTGLFCWCL